MRTLEERVADLERKLYLAKDILTIEEASLYTGLAKSYIYNLTSQHKIPFSKPMGKMIYFDKKELRDWMMQNRIATQEQLDQEALRYALSRD